jgi:CRP-like cAMP-binding protein
MLQLVRDVKRSVNSDLSMDWLKPFMTERVCTAGEILFYKDEKAEDLFYIVSGRYRLVESGIELPIGAIVGELGMLSPSNLRTQSLECIDLSIAVRLPLCRRRMAQLRIRRRGRSDRSRLAAAARIAASSRPICLKMRRAQLAL